MPTARDRELVEMRIAKVVGLRSGDQGAHTVEHAVVLEEVSGDGRLPIPIGPAEALSLAGTLSGVDLGRPQAPRLGAALVQALGGRVDEVRIEGLLEDAYVATVQVEGSAGVAEVDARPSDALNLGSLVGCPVLVAPEVLREAQCRRSGDGVAAAVLRSALEAEPMRVVGRRDEPS